MEVFQVALMFIALALLLWGIIKKIDPVVLLWVLGVGLFIIMGLIKGGIRVDIGNTGNVFLDGFAMLESFFRSQMGTICAMVLVVFGYVGILKQYKIAELFVNVITRPIQRVVKNTYLLASTSVFIGSLMILAFPNTVVVAILMLAIWFPVLVACGVTKHTAASSILVGSAFFRWGPANSANLLLLSSTDIPLSATDWWFQYQIPFFLPLMVIVFIVFTFTSKYFDKKENIAPTKIELVASGPIETYGLPKIYAIYPILPIVLLVAVIPVQGVNMSVIVAYMVCFFLFMLIEVIRTKSFIEVLNGAYGGFVKGMQESIGAVLIIIGGGLFSSALGETGGMNVMIGWIAYLGGNAFTMSLLGIILIFIVVIASSQANPNIPVFSQFFISVSQITGANLYPLLSLSTSTIGFTSILTPVHPQTVVIAKQGETALPILLKRSVPILILGAIASFIFSFVILGI